MWHILPTEQWIDGVVRFINENQLKPENSKFMMAFFSSLDIDFVDYFQRNKNRFRLLVDTIFTFLPHSSTKIKLFLMSTGGI